METRALGAGTGGVSLYPLIEWAGWIQGEGVHAA